MSKNDKGFKPRESNTLKQRFSLWLSDAQHQYLTRIAKSKGVKTATLATDIITKYIDGEILTGRVDFFLPQNNDLVPILKSLIYGELPEGDKLSHSRIVNAAKILETEPDKIYKLLEHVP
jgi:hypothetical protein